MPSPDDYSYADRAELRHVDAAVVEAKELLAQRDCHEARNDLMALVLHQSGCRKGAAYDPALVDGCLARLRLFAVTGRYPKEMLLERENELRESASD